ncbi:MAG: ribosomal protein L7/L12 [Ancrocorticia sp.]
MAENAELLARIAELEQEVARQQAVIADLESKAAAPSTSDAGATGGDAGAGGTAPSTTETAPSTSSTTPTTLPPLAQQALNEGRKVDAIKLVRDTYGISAAEAKVLVENATVTPVSVPANQPIPVPASGELPPLAQEALVAGNKVKAVKLVRETYGISLKEAKNLVDDAASRQGL